MGENKKLKDDPFRGSQQVFLDKYIETQNKAQGDERMEKKHPKFIGPVNFDPIKAKNIVEHKTKWRKSFKLYI